jgi:ABC-type nitrate/sulfonate/bicarbonate transport system substrate-binding protein
MRSALLVLALLGLSAWVWWRLPKRTFAVDAQAPARSNKLVVPGLRVGVPTSCFAGPALAASNQGSFAGPVVPFPNGKKALRALLAGEVDLAIAGDIPVAAASLDRDDFVVVGPVSESSFSAWLVVRPEVQNVASLRGKRIATQKNTGSHYVLDEVLRRAGLDETEVTVVDMEASTMKQALELKTIDAFSVEHTYVGDVQTHFGANAATLADPGAYVHRFLLVARRDVVRDRKAEIVAWSAAWKRASERWRQRPALHADALAQQLSALDDRGSDRGSDKGSDKRGENARSVERTVGECGQASFLGARESHLMTFSGVRNWFAAHGQTKRTSLPPEQFFDVSLSGE